MLPPKPKIENGVEGVDAVVGERVGVDGAGGSRDAGSGAFSSMNLVR